MPPQVVRSRPHDHVAVVLGTRASSVLCNYAIAGAQLLYLPPYSPDFSPIENFWSRVKSTLRSMGARTYQALEQAITDAFNQVCRQDIHNWFTHCCYCTSPN